MLISRSPRISEQEITTIIADSTQRFINDNKLCKYILNQAEHHRKVSFPTLSGYKELMDYYQKTLKPFKIDKIR
jgi:putative transposase